jgi:DNA primase
MKRADLIKESISIERVLSDYGYSVYEGGGEQQFSCDLHGDGSDNTPSARSYPESNSFYCFACGKVRDVIALVMEKEGLEFNRACSALERKYGLSEWVYKPKEEKDYFKESEPITNREAMGKRVGLQLELLTKEKILPLDKTLKLWEGYDLICSLEHQSIAHWRKLLQQIPQRFSEDDTEQ